MRSLKTLHLLCSISLIFQVTIGVANAIKENGKLWAVLVAGSSSYYNYRHQADICHAYQILHRHGIPDEQIVVMMYDDIAFSQENPTPGIIINRPNGTNVYPGVPKDYTGSHVTPENFLNVLLGKEEIMRGVGSGKVLKSGPNDHVFVNFADHGAPGLLAFPEGELYVKDFLNTLDAMHKNKLYEKMVIYVEACESGSMFSKQLPANVYATTAANSEESSYACYYDDDRQTYLGDVYSVKWMEDSDQEDLLVETLKKQFQIVKAETNTSHVQHFGDLKIGNLHVGEFQGLDEVPMQSILPKVSLNAVPAPEVPLHILQKKLQKLSANSDEFTQVHKELHKLQSNRAFLKEKMEQIVQISMADETAIHKVFDDHKELENLDCYKNVAKYFSKHCFSLSKNDYALRYMYVFVNMCEAGIKQETMRKAMDISCVHPSIYGIH